MAEDKEDQGPEQPSALVQDQAPSKRCAKPDGRSVLVKRTSWYLAMDKTAPQP